MKNTLKNNNYRTLKHPSTIKIKFILIINERGKKLQVYLHLFSYNFIKPGNILKTEYQFVNCFFFHHNKWLDYMVTNEMIFFLMFFR